MLTHFRLENFKAFKDTGWIELKPITYLMGNNSAGKSTILKAMLFIKQFLQQNDENGNIDLSSSMVDLGNFGNVVNDTKKPFSIYFRYNISRVGPIRSRHTGVWRDQVTPKFMEGQYDIILEFRNNGTMRTNLVQVSRVKLVSAKFGELININLLDKNFNGTKIQFNLTGLSSNGLDTFFINKTMRSVLLGKSKEKNIKHDLSELIPKEYLNEILFSQKLIENNNLPKGVFNISGRSTPFSPKTFLRRVSVSLKEDSEDWIAEYFSDMDNKASNEFSALMEKHNPKLFRRYTFHPQFLSNEDRKKDNHIALYNFIMDHLNPFNYLFNILDACASDLEYCFFTLVNIDPLRANPSRTYSKIHTTIGQELFDRLLDMKKSQQKNIITFISKFLKDADFGDKLSIKTLRDLGSIYRVRLKTDGNKERDIIDLGFGTSQILPIIINSVIDEFQKTLKPQRHTPSRLYAPKIRNKSLLLIQQPEIHLHPAAQAKMADFFISLIEKFDKNIFIETHSEHMILKTQVAIKNDPKLADKCQIIFIKKKKGSSKVQTIGFKKDGILSKPWPDDFFDKSYKLQLDLM